MYSREATLKKFDRAVLDSMAKYYGVSCNIDTSKDEIVYLVARALETSAVIEADVLEKCFTHAVVVHPTPSVESKRRRHHLDSELARVGEQVAAKVSKSDENGSWILGNVLKYEDDTFSIQDEDDATRVMSLPVTDVRRLEDTAVHLKKGDKVIAVFPDTTSFYRAVVVKNPKSPVHGNGGWDVIVRFFDDEDDNGKVPARRVPARFVLRTDVTDTTTSS